MTSNPYPKDTMDCMRANDKVSLFCTISTLDALTAQPTSITPNEAIKIQEAIASLEEVLDNWHNYKEPTNV